MEKEINNKADNINLLLFFVDVVSKFGFRLPLIARAIKDEDGDFVVSRKDDKSHLWSYVEIGTSNSINICNNECQKPSNFKFKIVM